jgi:nicotinate-nucleotide pyrophosphorylase (carboxylating)
MPLDCGGKLYFCSMLNKNKLAQLINRALQEDLGEGDHTTLSCIDPGTRGKAVLHLKQVGILAGLEVAAFIFHLQETGSVFHAYKQDGDTIHVGEKAFEVEGGIHTILACERLVLNCMQRMSGIATLTRRYSEKIKPYHAKLLDTRKTTPNFRLLEKEAVRIGGGYNHRFGLYDMILLKDNHIDYCGGIEKAILRADAYVRTKKPGLKIELETRTIEDVKKAVETGRGKISRIMLDNFTPAKIKEALIIIGDQFETEASGGITLDNIEEFAATGVDFISVGALIHQARSLDMSLKAEMA